MNALANITSTATMTSKELATLTEIRHDNVKRTIDTLANQGVISQPQIEDGEKSANGVVEKIYRIGKRDSYIIVAQLSPEFTARLVDRWQALEQQASNPVATMSRVDLLKLALDSEEQRLQLEYKVVELAPKAEALDRIAMAEGSFCIRDTAKTLQLREKDLKTYLLQHHWLYRRPMNAGYLAYSDKLQQGLVEHKTIQGERGDGSEWVASQARITAKGLTRLATEFSARVAA